MCYFEVLSAGWVTQGEVEQVTVLFPQRQAYDRERERKKYIPMNQELNGNTNNDNDNS